MYIYWIIMVVLMATALIITIRIANSNENKHANPEYHKGTRTKLLRLTTYYVIATGIGVIVFLLYLYYR